MTAVDDRPTTEIGAARKRKEDRRLITGRTRWTDNIALPGHAAPRDGAQPVRPRDDHRASTPRPPERRTASSPSSPASDIADIQGVNITAWPLNAEQKTPDHLPIAERPGRPRRRDRRRRRRPFRGRRARRGRAGRRRLRRAARGARPQGGRDRLGAGPPGARHQQVRVLAARLQGRRHRRRRRRGHRQGARERHRHRARVPAAAAHPGVHGASLDRRRPDRRAGDDVVGHPDPPHPAVLHRGHDRASPSPRSGSSRPTSGVASAASCRRPRRSSSRSPSRASWQAVQVHRDPLGDDGVRPPRPRPVAEAHPRRREGRHRHGAEGRAARRPRRLRRRSSVVVCRCSVRGCSTRSTSSPRTSFNCHELLHQQDVGRRLPWRRAPGGHVRHRAAHGRARRRGRGRPPRDPREELDQARGVPLHHRGRA